MLDSVAGKRIMHTPAPLRKSEAALLFNNLSDNLCGHSKIRILNVARRKMCTGATSDAIHGHINDFLVLTGLRGGVSEL